MRTRFVLALFTERESVQVSNKDAVSTLSARAEPRQVRARVRVPSGGGSQYGS